MNEQYCDVESSAEAIGVVEFGRPAERLFTSLRTVSAERTLERIQPVLRDIGVIHVNDVSLAGVPSCPVYQVIRDDMRSDYLNAGKGFSAIESQVSGLMEAIEVHHFERATPALLSRAANGVPRVPACTLGMAGEGLNDPADGQWIQGWDYRARMPVMLPAECVFMQVDGATTSASANGIASGNTMTEAVFHALGEMLERHALARFFGHGRFSGRAAIDHIERVSPPEDSAVIQQCLFELGQQDIGAEFILISSDAGVAVFICFLDIPVAAGVRGAVQGFGAHPDMAIAMSRALAEAVQLLALCPAAPQEPGLDRAEGPAVIMTSKQLAQLDPRMLQAQRIQGHAALQSIRARFELVEFDYMTLDAELPSRGSVSIEEEVLRLVDNLAAMGCGAVYSCVISPPELPVVVVKCLCPGLDCINDL